MIKKGDYVRAIRNTMDACQIDGHSMIIPGDIVKVHLSSGMNVIYIMTCGGFNFLPIEDVELIDGEHYEKLAVNTFNKYVPDGKYVWNTHFGLLKTTGNLLEV